MPCWISNPAFGDDLLSQIHPSSKQFPAHAAAEYNNVRVLNLIRIKGGNLNVTDGDGKHPLHFAASRKNVAAVKFLLR